MQDSLKSTGVFPPAVRISFALVLLNACLILMADLLGFIPIESKYLLDERKKVSEALAIQFTIFSPGQDSKNIEKVLRNIVARNPEIESAGIRLLNGELILQINEHVTKWGQYSKEKSSDTHLIVPIFQYDKPWAKIEIKFHPLATESGISFYMQPIFKMSGFILLIGFFANLAFMLRALRVLDPASILPERVNAAFDTFSESIVIVDEREQIILANKAFTKKLARPLSSLIGFKLSNLEWKKPSDNIDSGTVSLPWQIVLKTGKKFIGSHLSVRSNDTGQESFFIVNASPIQDGKENTLGVLVTLDDVTELEKSHGQLQVLVTRLEESQASIEQKNLELNFLATRDPLTGCLNRRSFSELYYKAFKEAKNKQSELSFIMTDIDFFKKVNDNYGHAVGDEVIKFFAEILQASVRKIDLLSRYGGEEFSIALPELSAFEAAAVAERIRLRLKNESIRHFANRLQVTASFGIASLNDGPDNPDTLQQLADKALYLAKQSGRDRVSQWEAVNQTADTGGKALTEHEVINKKNNEEDARNLQQRVNELESMASKFSEELEYTKHYDAITGLPNQVLFYDRIGQVVERSERYDILIAVLIIDVKQINQANTTFGLEVGNKFLKEIGERLRKTFRKYDAISQLTISRFGGDDFAILLNDIINKENIIWIISRIQNILEEKIIIDGNTIFLTSHIGISLYPYDADNIDELIRNAMLAKEYCKQQTEKSYYQFYDEQMQKLAIKQINLDLEIRDSILYENWLLLYQPKMDIKTKTIVGVEALVRWQHPTRGVVSPFEFVEFAEQRGLITAIGDWIIRTACQQIQQWMSIGWDCKVSVNISVVQLKQEDFVEKLFNALAAYGVPPRQLELELTESVLMNNFDHIVQALRRLNSGGIKIAIDDFGTGYSSLSYLKNLPLDILKIDRSFIKDICRNDNDRQIIKALISIGHTLGMKVVAEGIEDKDQLDLLAEFECDEIQGYLLSKPVSSDEIILLLSQNIDSILNK